MYQTKTTNSSIGTPTFNMIYVVVFLCPIGAINNTFVSSDRRNKFIFHSIVRQMEFNKCGQKLRLLVASLHSI